VGLDAFSVPMQGAGAGPAEHRMLDTAVVYTPDKKHHRYLVDGGPTEAGCKIIGERLKGSGMRWVYDGAATVGALRALYVSGPKVWDGFWSQPHHRAA
jgi:hypothetical protein